MKTNCLQTRAIKALFNLTNDFDWIGKESKAFSSGLTQNISTNCIKSSLIIYLQCVSEVLTEPWSKNRDDYFWGIYEHS